MNDRIAGITLSLNDYHDNDVMMQVFTREYGIITLIGKSAKKIESKNHFFPMCLYEFIIDYKEGKSIFTVKNHKLLSSYFSFKDLKMNSYINIFLETCIKAKDFITEEIFDNLCFVLERINEENKYVLGSMFFSHLLKEFGIVPNVDGCVVCGDQKVITLSNSHGGFLCKEHGNVENSIEPYRLKKFRLIIKGSFEHYDIIKEYDYDNYDFRMVCDFFIANSDIKIKSYDFYESL